jgi:hypothetical protein
MDNTGTPSQTTIQSNGSISETVRNRTHVHVKFLLRMTDTMTSQNIVLSSWDILYNSCTGIYKFGNNTYPRRIRGRSNLGQIFRGKKSVSYGPGNTVNPMCHLLALLGADHILHVSRIRVKGHKLSTYKRE